MKKPSTTPALGDIPHASENQTHRSLMAKRGELGTRLDALTAWQAEIEQRTSSSVSNQAAAVHRLLENPMAEVDLSDGLIEGNRKVFSDIDIVRRAIVALDAEILRQEAEHDGNACAALKPLHRRHVREVLNAQLALHRAVRRQESIRDGLVGKGYSRTSQLVPHFHQDFRFGLDDINSWLASDLRTAMGEGFVSEAERSGLMRGEIETLDETAPPLAGSQ